MHLLLGLLMAIAGSVSQISPPAKTDEILALLSNLHVDKTQIHKIRDITIRRDALSISFNRGTIAFFEPVMGRVIGGVFIGSGEVVAIPPDPAEKQQLYKFTGSPLLNEPFSGAVLRFTDDTYEEIMKERAQRAEEEVSSEDSAQVLSWDQTLSSYSGVMNYRILSDFVTPSVQPLFFAELNGEKAGPFEVAFDPRSVEEVAVFKIHQTTASPVADLWASFNQRSEARNPEAVAHEDKAVVDILAYDVDALVSTANRLEARTTMRVRGLVAGERVLNFKLSHLLRVSSVSLDSGEPVSFYQEAGANIVTIVVPRGFRTGEEVMLQFAYAGDAADKRESWYPNLGYQDRATFNLTFHFPTESTLAATGNKAREWEENGLRHSTWKSDGELPVAVFHTGASILDAGDITYFTDVLGPYPYTQLKVSQSPQGDAQSWPGLIELPSGAESAAELARAQAVARQWFGNSVGMASYRDQWLMEGLARYAAAMYIQAKYPNTPRLHEILDDARSRLFEREPNGSTNEEAGPIWLGERLSSTITPTGYRAAYNKGIWVVHMLRMLMRQNGSNPDAAFLRMIREFVESYKGKNASTWDFKRLAEKYMTSALDLRGDTKLDWFFDEWVFATGVPAYSLDYKVEPASNTFIVSGTIKRTGVSGNFTMPIPLYADDIFLGRVPVGDDEETFRFQITKKPERLIMDPQATILTRP